MKTCLLQGSDEGHTFETILYLGDRNLYSCVVFLECQSDSANQPESRCNWGKCSCLPPASGVLSRGMPTGSCRSISNCREASREPPWPPKPFILCQVLGTPRRQLQAERNKPQAKNNRNPTCGLELEACCVGPRNRKLQALMGWGVAPLDVGPSRPREHSLPRLSAPTSGFLRQK